MRARIVAGGLWRDVADALHPLLRNAMRDVEPSQIVPLFERLSRAYEGVTALVEDIEDIPAVERALAEAGVPAVRLGDAIVVVERKPPIGEPPWRVRAPEVYAAIDAALSAYNAPAQNVVWPGGVIPLAKRTHVMGIVNVTPDSFSDGGRFYDTGAAIKHGARLVEEGADLLDIGGESTRPGAEPVPADEEIARVVPVIEALRAAGCPVAISIDTMKATVASAALDAGAAIVNDVSAGRADPGMLPLVAERGVPVILMHMRGEPRTMQENPTYRDVVGEVFAFLAERADAAQAAGVAHGRILVDPGFGFGKTREHNLVLLRRLRELTCLGYPLVVGTSRKRFIGATLDLPVDDRLEGTAATVALAVAAGAGIVRVHDVAAMRRVAGMVEAIVGATDPGGGDRS